MFTHFHQVKSNDWTMTFLWHFCPLNHGIALIRIFQSGNNNETAGHKFAAITIMQYLYGSFNKQNNTEQQYCIAKSLETVISIIKNIYLNIFYFLCELLYYTYAQSNNLQIQRILYFWIVCEKKSLNRLIDFIKLILSIYFIDWTTDRKHLCG